MIKNINKRLLSLALAGSISFSLIGCSNDSARKVIKKTSFKDDNSEISLNYDNKNIDTSKTHSKVFEPNEHILIEKVAGTLNYDSLVELEVPEGYEVINVDYCENSTGQFSVAYGYFTVTLQNKVSVCVLGYYDTNSEEYVYTSFGEVVEDAKTYTKK